jgi:hypothetical protein
VLQLDFSHFISSSESSKFSLVLQFTSQRLALKHSVVSKDVVFVFVTDNILTVRVEDVTVHSLWRLNSNFLLIRASTAAAEDLNEQMESQSEGKEDVVLPEEHLDCKLKVCLQSQHQQAGGPAVLVISHGVVNVLLVFCHLHSETDRKKWHQDGLCNGVRSDAFVTAKSLLNKVASSELANQHVKWLPADAADYSLLSGGQPTVGA